MKVLREDFDGKLETSEIRCDRCGFESRLSLGVNAMFEIQEICHRGVHRWVWCNCL